MMNVIKLGGGIIFALALQGPHADQVGSGGCSGVVRSPMEAQAEELRYPQKLNAKECLSGLSKR
jgi:hypothetical protein